MRLPHPQALPAQVFAHLQYAKTEREGLDDLITCGDVR